MSKTTEILKKYLFAYQNGFYSVALEQAFNYFVDFLYKIQDISADSLKDKLFVDSVDKYSEDNLILYAEFYHKKYLFNLYNISTNDFGFIFIIYFLYYLNQYENNSFKDKFIEEVTQKDNFIVFFEELYSLLSFVEKNKDYQQDVVKLFFTNEFKSRTINQIVENVKLFLEHNPIIELNNMLFILADRLDLFNKLFEDKTFSINDIAAIFSLFQKEEWSYIISSILISPSDDYDINEDELKAFIRLYWVYHTLINFRKHLKIFTTDYFYHKKNENKKISKAEEIAQSHYLLYLRQFLDKGNDEHMIIDHEKHFGNSRYDILINAYKGFPPLIIECKFTVDKITESDLNDWIKQIYNYIQGYNQAFSNHQINIGLLLVFHNNKDCLEDITILESLDNEFYRIQKYSDMQYDLYLYSINID